MAINFSSGGDQTRPAVVRTSVYQSNNTQNVIDFESIPSSVKKITVWFHALGYTGTDGHIRIAIGDSGGVETTGYNGATVYVHSGNAIYNTTTGVPCWSVNSGEHIVGRVDIENQIGTNWWIFAGNGMNDGASYTWMCSGRKYLSGTLDRVRIYGDGGGNFDNGYVWLSYEG